MIETALPRGEHKVNIYAHNPVGWSEQPYSSYFLQVISAGYRPSILTQYWPYYIFILVINISLIQLQSTTIYFDHHHQKIVSK